MDTSEVSNVKTSVLTLTDARERKLSYKRKGGRDQKSRLQRQALILASAEDVAKRNRDKTEAEGQQGLLTLNHSISVVQ